MKNKFAFEVFLVTNAILSIISVYYANTLFNNILSKVIVLIINILFFIFAIKKEKDFFKNSFVNYEMFLLSFGITILSFFYNLLKIYDFISSLK